MRLEKVNINNTIYERPYESSITDLGSSISFRIVKPDDVAIEQILENFQASSIDFLDAGENLLRRYNDYSKLKSALIEYNVVVNYDNEESEDSLGTAIYGTIIEITLLKQTEIEELRKKIEANKIIPITIPNVSSLPKTVYDDSILKSMTLLSKKLSNADSVITDFSIIITDGSVTANGVVSDTTDITLYLINIY